MSEEKVEIKEVETEKKSVYQLIGERMKNYEAIHSEKVIDPRKPYMIRLDGHTFHTFAAPFEKPFDANLDEVMILTAKDLLLKFHASTVYTESDEISLIFPALIQTKEDETKALPFSGRATKIATLAASYCSVRFNYHCVQNQKKWSKDLKTYDKIIQALNSAEAHFDGRVFNLDSDDEVLNNILWRSNYDCQRNAKSRFGRAYFSANELHGLSSNDVIKKVKEEKKIDFEDCPNSFKYGTFVKRILVDRETNKFDEKHQKTDEKIIVKRTSTMELSFKIDKFTKENVDFLMCKTYEIKQEEIKKEEIKEQVEDQEKEEQNIEKLKKEEIKVDLTEEQQARFDLMRSVGEECLLDHELKLLIKNKKEQIICYDGFEPSGRIHIAQGIMKAINVNKLTKAGCKFIFLVADWFALMNNKMGGDLEKIKVVGEYLIEVWKATGMDLENVEFKWSSDIINKESNRYWLTVLDIARKFNVPRIVRCSQIMGRKESNDLSSAQIFYPCMQCADIFFLKADICQLGMDQRKVNMLAREYCDEAKPKKKFKPIILSHHMLMGLTGEKMSKSDPNSAIFMDDSEQDVKTKIKKSFCEPGNIEKNPPLEYIKYIILPVLSEFKVKTKDGKEKVYTDIDTITKDFKSEALHPSELKPALADAINLVLKPVRDHFEKNQDAKKLMEKVKSFKVTK